MISFDKRRHPPAVAVACVALLLYVPHVHAAEPVEQQQTATEQQAAEVPTPFLVTVTISNGGGEIIRDALRSVVDWVDQCLLLDTGIKDKTLDIAQDVVGDKLQITRIHWPADFSKARNAALEAAARTGASWAVILDTDERIQYDQDKLDWRQYLSSSTADVISILHDSLTYKKVTSCCLNICIQHVDVTAVDGSSRLNSQVCPYN
jgi:hypothetical protein